MKSLKRIGVVLAIVLVVALFGGLIIAGMRWWTNEHYGAMIYDIDDVPESPVAIVFGAGVYPDGTLSAVLEDRVENGRAALRGREGAKTPHDRRQQLYRV